MLKFILRKASTFAVMLLILTVAAPSHAQRNAWTWGYNGYGQLGNGTTTNSSVPVKVANLSGVVELANNAAYGINPSGQVVGSRPDADGDAFLWDPIHGMRDLNSLLPAYPGGGSVWVYRPAAINDRGQIVGRGGSGAFLLTPQ